MRTLLQLAAVLMLWAGSAEAQARSAHLLDDAPKMTLAAAPRLLEAALGANDVKESAVVRMGFGEHLVKTSVIGFVGSASGVLLGAALGSLSNNLIGAAIPVLLSNLFVPPVLTVLAAMLIGNLESPGRFGFWLPLAGAFVVNAAAYVITSLFLVVPWTNPLALLLYSLVDGVLMSGASVGIMHLTEKKPTQTVTSFVPGISETTMVPMVKVNW